MVRYSESSGDAVFSAFTRAGESTPGVESVVWSGAWGAGWTSLLVAVVEQTPVLLLYSRATGAYQAAMVGDEGFAGGPPASGPTGEDPAIHPGLGSLVVIQHGGMAKLLGLHYPTTAEGGQGGEDAGPVSATYMLYRIVPQAQAVPYGLELEAEGAWLLRPGSTVVSSVVPAFY